MSRFIDTVIATAGRSPRGMTTGAPDSPLWRSWAQVHAIAGRMAASLQAGGLRPESAVAILAGEPVQIAPAAQAVWLCGGSVTMLHQPTARTDLSVWQEDTLQVLKMIGSDMVLLGPPFDPLAPILTAHGIGFRMIDELAAESNQAQWTPVSVSEESAALLQLTSGSTADPKAVRITHANLYSNLSEIAIHLEVEQDTDAMVSWLPMFHDMGMVACLLMPMFTGIGLVSSTPAEFLSRPLLWAELISKFDGTMSTAPSFAWTILGRALARAEPGSLDLSRLRITANGAEPIDPDTMAAFSEAAARFGVRPESVNCCYGAAESTVAVSMSRLTDRMIVDVIDAAELEKNRRAVPVSGPHHAGVRRFPLLGSPFPGIEVRVVGEAGEVLGEREVGVLQLRGAPVTQGYLTMDGPVNAQDEQGWLDIGDEGYLVDGQIVVCGRRKDVIIMAGRNIYPTDIERAAGAVEGVRQGNVVAVRLLADGMESGRESFAVVLESRLAGDAEAEQSIREAVTARVLAEVDARPTRVVVVAPGGLPKTPSGKLRRDAARELL